MSTLFHLIRHASHDQLGRRLTGRTPGCPLSGKGEAEAQRLAASLSARPIDAFVTSPQQRTRQTAEIIAAGRCVQSEVAEALDEIDFGRWAGQTFETLDVDPDWIRWNADRGRAATPAGETMQDVALRLTRLMDTLRARFPGGTVALVSHCDVIKAGLCRILGLPFERLDRFEIAPASMSTVVMGEGGGKLLAFNTLADEAA